MFMTIAPERHRLSLATAQNGPTRVTAAAIADSSQYWNGMLLDVWAPIQTLNPPTDKLSGYSGYDLLPVFTDIGLPLIPLDVRFENFVSRLNRFKKKVLHQ